MRVVLVVLLLAASLLAGCIEFSVTRETVASAQGARSTAPVGKVGDCPAMVKSCVWGESAAGPTLVIEGGQYRAETGMFSLFITAPVARLAITGFDFHAGAVVIGCGACDVLVADGRLRANDQSQTGLAISVNGTVTISNVTLEGHPQAARLHARDILVVGLALVGNGGGVMASATGRLDARDLMCSGTTGTCLSFIGASARIVEATMSGGTTGIAFTGWRSTDGDGPALLVAQSSIDGMRSAGVSASATSLEVVGNSFRGNGGPDGRGAIDLVLWEGGSATVQGNSFQGNQPYGVAAYAGVLPVDVDARGNWWGGPTGPVLRPSTPGMPLPTEDAVSEGVAFLPFLTGPP